MANWKRDKSLFRDSYLISLLNPLKSITDAMHLGGNLKFFNECGRSHIGATTSINDELAYLVSNSALGMEDLLHLARFKRNIFGVKDFLNHQ